MGEVMAACGATVKMLGRMISQQDSQPILQAGTAAASEAEILLKASMKLFHFWSVRVEFPNSLPSVHLLFAITRAPALNHSTGVGDTSGRRKKSDALLQMKQHGQHGSLPLHVFHN